MTGIKNDQSKAPWHLLPFDALSDVVRVLDFGQRKYAPRNWEGGIAYSRVFAATQRHMVAWWQGEDSDAETGISHLAHAVCCTLFLLAFAARKRTDLDDRPGADRSRESSPRNYLGRVEPSPLRTMNPPLWQSLGGMPSNGRWRDESEPDPPPATD